MRMRPESMASFAPMKIPIAIALAVALPALPASAADDARAVAVKYLEALTGKGDQAGRDLTFGGKTTSIELEQLENFEITSEKPVKREEGPLPELSASIAKLDKAGKSGAEKAMAK